MKHFFAIAFCLLFLSCADFPEISYENRIEIVYGDDLVDSRGGYISYKTVVIGNQTWMAENLKYQTTGVACYGNNPANCNKYGALYDWETAMFACPDGWQLPSDDEWETLTRYVGGPLVAGNRLKATSGWEDYEDENSLGVLLSGNGTDRYGFSALPAGFVNAANAFRYEGLVTILWTSTPSSNTEAYSRMLFNMYNDIVLGEDDKSLMFSVRCIKNED